MFTDAVYLSNLIVSMPDRVILSLVDGLLSMPVWWRVSLRCTLCFNGLLVQVGRVACEEAARVLLDGTDMRPAASPAVVFALLDKDEATFIDLVACKSVSSAIHPKDVLIARKI